MASVKELKSIDLSSYTIITTGTSVLLSVILSVIAAVGIGITSPENIGILFFIIPTVIVGTFMLSIYSNFSDGLFYNLLAKRLNPIKFTFNNEKELVKVTNTETAIMIAIIAAIQMILIYLVSSFILPLVLNATIQTLMYSGQQTVAYAFYQMMVFFNQPMTIALIILTSFVFAFVFVLLGTYIYNILGANGRGIILNLSKQDNLTVIDSIDVLKFAIAIAVVRGILSLIMGLILLITGGNVQSLTSIIIDGFGAGFIESALLAIFYNYLAPKLGKLKLELIDN